MTEPDPRAVTFLAQKGGQGKSTGAKNTAAELAARGHRVLLMDLDDNAHLTKDPGTGRTPTTNPAHRALSSLRQKRQTEQRDSPNRLGIRLHPE